VPSPVKAFDFLGSLSPGFPHFSRVHYARFADSPRDQEKNSKEIHSPNVTSALAPEFQKADHHQEQGESSNKPLAKKLARSLKSRF
jgi:hypothetical protein